jgi:3',5'-cyclic-nucleotide phosphodiesterase
MELLVTGCHGGESRLHKPTGFVLDGILAIDAGSLTSGLDLDAQYRLEAAVISHPHLDHVRDLATIVDNRIQKGCPPLLIAATKATIQTLKKHFFNGKLWPDFTKIPSADRPTITFRELPLRKPVDVAGYEIRAIPVTHTIDAAALFVRSQDGTLVYSGDTGPTDELWAVTKATPEVRGIVVETSFPNREQRLATLSGHHTPRTLKADLAKLGRGQRPPTFVFHMKPRFEDEIRAELGAQRSSAGPIEVMHLGQRIRF